MAKMAKNKGPKKYRRGAASALSVKAIQAAKKQAKALRMRAEGHSFQSIADVLGFSQPCGAYQCVLAGLKASLQEPGEELRILELERIDHVLLSIQPWLKQGNLHAIDRFIRLSQHRCKLLGLYLDQSERPFIQVNQGDEGALLLGRDGKEPMVICGKNTDPDEVLRSMRISMGMDSGDRTSDEKQNQ